MKQNRCVICGNIIPKGRQVCPNCNRIKVGDTVKCLTCGQPITVKRNDTYIYCKNCKNCYDIKEYNLRGKKYNERVF